MYNNKRCGSQLYVLDCLSLRQNNQLTLKELLQDNPSNEVFENLIDSIGCILPGGVYISGFMISTETLPSEDFNLIKSKLRDMVELFRSDEVTYPELFLYISQRKNKSFGLLNLETGNYNKLPKVSFKPTEDIVLPLTMKFTRMMYTPIRNTETYSQIEENQETYMAS